MIEHLGFVTASLAWRDDGGHVWTNAGLGRLIEATARRADSFKLAISHVRDRQDQHDHRLELPRGSVRFLPSMRERRSFSQALRGLLPSGSKSLP